MASPRHIWRYLVIPVVLAAAAVAVWARWEAHQAKRLALPDRARKSQLPVPVRTTPVSQQTVEVTIGAPGVTAASEQVFIRIGSDAQLNQLNPVISKMRVHDGTYVRAGDLLFEFEAQHFDGLVAQRKQALETTQAALARAESAQTENATTRQTELQAAASELEFRQTDVQYRGEDYERMKKLRDSGNASFTEFLEAASAYAEARYRLTQAVYRDRVAQAEMVLGPLRDRQEMETAVEAVKLKTYELALAEANLQRCQLRSPLEGYMDKVLGAPGQLVDVNVTLAEVLKIDPIHFQVDFPQERVGELAVGQPAEVVLDSFPKEMFHGKVLRISARVDPERRVLPVEVEISNPDHRIKVGVTGYARIHSSRTATTVPAIAVIGIESQAMAFVVEDGRVHIRSVKTGPVTSTGYREVEEGLAAGDEVVIYGQQYLEDGEPVNTDWRQWARRD